MNKIYHFFMLMIFLLCSFTINAQTNRELLAMEPKDFFELPRVNEKINIYEPNNDLLAIATFQATNLLRQRAHLPALIWQDSLYASSEIHIEQMIENNFIDHINPYSEVYKTPFNRIQSQGGKFVIVAENIAHVSIFKSNHKGKYKFTLLEGQPKYYELDGKPLQIMTYGEFAKSILTDWYRSKPHRFNLLDTQVTELGVAVQVAKANTKKGHLPQVYGVQNFGKPFNSSNSN